MSSVKRKSKDKTIERKGVRNRSRKFYRTFALQNLQIKLQKRYQALAPGPVKSYFLDKTLLSSQFWLHKGL